MKAACRDRQDRGTDDRAKTGSGMRRSEVHRSIQQNARLATPVPIHGFLPPPRSESSATILEQALGSK